MNKEAWKNRPSSVELIKKITVKELIKLLSTTNRTKVDVPDTIAWDLYYIIQLSSGKTERVKGNKSDLIKLLKNEKKYRLKEVLPNVAINPANYSIFISQLSLQPKVLPWRVPGTSQYQILIEDAAWEVITDYLGAIPLSPGNNIDLTRIEGEDKTVNEQIYITLKGTYDSDEVVAIQEKIGALLHVFEVL